MKKSPAWANAWVSYAGILFAGLCSHGFILLSDYRLWDGWEFSLWLSNPEQTPFLMRLFAESGRPLDGLYFLPLKATANPHILAKAFGVTAWLAHVVLMHEVVRRDHLLGPALALAVSLLVVTCPVFRPLGELTFWMYTCEAMLFWLAALLFLKMTEMQETRQQMVLRVLGLVCLFIALNLNSLLVFFYGLVAALFLRHASQNGLRAAFEEAVGIARRYPDILLLPVVFWFWKSWFTPSYGPYANYNRPTLDLLMWARGYLVLATNFVAPFAVEPFTRPGVIVVSGVASAIVVSRLRARPACGGLFDNQRLPVAPSVVAAAGFVLLFAASFPYICVGHVLADEPWLARNNILTPLPMALLVVAMAAWATAKIVPSRPTAWFAVCLAICGIWGASCVAGYVRLQAFGVKQLAIRAHMRELIKERSPTVIQFRDYAPIRGGIAYYPPLIWTAMAACCDRAPRTLVFDSRIAVPDQQVKNGDGSTQIVLGTLSLSAANVRQIIEDTTTPYALQEIPQGGSQFLLAALPTAKMASPERLALDYLRLRWESNADVEDWVKQVVEVKVLELEPIRAEPTAQ